MRRIALLAVAATAAVLPVAFGGSSASASILPCIPSMYGSGPTVYADIDYAHPAQSTVDYDTTDFSVRFDLCVI